jgi:lantibiotic modifying enzyme
MECKEDHILYRLISGVHANINMHITHFDFDTDGQSSPPDYKRYFETVGKHKERINNLFYTYSFVLRAVNKLSGKIDGFSYLSDNKDVNDHVKLQLNNLIESSIRT